MKLRTANLMMGILALVFVFSSQALSSDWNQVKGTFERKLEVSGPAKLDVVTNSGDVTLRTGPVSSVYIKGKIQIHFESDSERDRAEKTLSDIQQNPPLEQNGNSIRVGHVNGTRDMNHTSIDYEIVVPPGSNLIARSGSGDLHIAGPLAEADVETGSGDVSIESVKGSLHLSTGSGDIALREAGGSGAEVRTGSGDVDCVLPSTGGFDFSVATGSGDISAESGLTIETGNTSRGKWRAKIRGGGAAYSVETGSGDIRIH